MGELLKFVTKVLLGSTAVGAGAALIKNGTENAAHGENPVYGNESK